MRRKHTVARRVTHRVLLTLFVAMILLFTAAFFVARNSVIKETRKFSQAIAAVYGDLVSYDTAQKGIAVDESQSEIVRFYGDYVCKWYNVDYAYIYVLDVQEKEIHYIGASCDEEKFGKTDFANKMTGRVVKGDISEEELAVWMADGIETDPMFAHIETNNEFGHELTTIIRSYDCYGNKFLAGVDMDYGDVYLRVFHTFGVIALILLLVLGAVGVMSYVIVRRRVSKPMQAIATAMDEFITDGKRNDVLLDEVGGDDEFNRIASAFNHMTANIDEYLENINALTRDSERQETELEIAARIQRGFLPKEHLLSKNYEMHTLMKPAKNVGGDLYDYAALDDHRVLVVIADVSGKGVAASIFMSVTLTLIHQFAKMGLSPAEILNRTNESLCRNNPAMLFVTALVGVYDTDTNEFTYSNAGHDRPYIVGETVRRLDELAGTMLGLFTDEAYEETTVTLKTGETLFMYTDGVSETVSDKKEFFGLSRLEAVLAEAKANHVDNPVAHVLGAITTFANGAEQHDDITMLALTAKTTTELTLAPDVREFEKIKTEILKAPLPRKKLLDFCLAAEECFVNICSYAFGESPPPEEKIFATLTVSDRLTLRLADGGKPFNPLENINDPDDYDIDTQIGGLGRFIAVSAVDGADYEYKDGQNVLTLIDYIEEEQK